jgi:DNA-binding NarL/FixJ family response regulator
MAPVRIASYPGYATSPRGTALSNWAAAMRAFRASLEIYRHVLAARSRREARPVSVQAAPPRVLTLPVAAPALSKLTTREREVAYLMATGYTNQQIAERLVLTRGTVANHVAHILAKLGVSNRTQVATLVFRSPTEGLAREA